MMAEEELEQYVRNAMADDCFSYTERLIKKILKESDNWTIDWSTVFIRILARIKKTGGTANLAVENGRIVNLPLGKKYYMALLFEQQKSGYFINDFKIGNRS